MVVEGEAVGGAVGVHVEGGGQETGLVPVLARPRCLDVHVETWHKRHNTIRSVYAQTHVVIGQ